MRGIIDTLEQRGEDRGLAMGRAAGKVEGKADAIVMLLEQRFGELTNSHSFKVRWADERTLDRWIGRLLSATSIADLLNGKS